MSAILLRRKLLCATVFLALATVANANNHQTSQSDPDLGHGTTKTINDDNDIFSNRSNGQTVLWKGQQQTVLDASNHDVTASAIDHAGQSTGFDHSTKNSSQAIELNDKKSLDLDKTKGLQSVITDVNSSGSSVGYTYRANDRDDKQAVMWIKGKTILLNDTDKNMNSEALAINNVGQEAGFVTKDGSGIKQAVLWNGTRPTLLGSIGAGTSSVATDINDKGFAVGFSSVNKLDVKAVLWNGKKATVLTSLGGTVSKALGINDLGQIVGYSYTKDDAKKEAVMWDGSKIINLNSYLTSAEKASGWILQQATAINDNGTIIGQAYNTKTGKTNDAFELNAVAAVPEPASYGMLLAGLGLIGLLALRRKSN